MAKCEKCTSAENIVKITIPVMRKGKIVKYRTVRVCPNCLNEHFPEYIDAYPSLEIRGSTVGMKRP